MDILVKTFSELTTRELYEILKARFEVFVMEQHCFYLDLDDIDYEALHLFLWEGDRVEAYIRLFPDRLAPDFYPHSPDPNAWHLGRLLTRQRGRGLGRRMMERAIEEAQARGVTVLRMEAQCYIVPLYEQYGFRVLSDPFDDAGVLHVEIEKTMHYSSENCISTSR